MLKYLFDRIVAFFGLLLLWPLLLFVALLIRATMPGGPVLFVQQRVGKDGQLFRCHKFRTMRTPNDDAADSDASRITPLGTLLRRYKIDELPQLWDVLTAKMSFVGPRPDVPGYADKLQGDDRKLLTLRPGITGPASLKYRNEEEILANMTNPLEYNDTVIWPDKVRLNLYYLKHYSFLTDLKIIFATVLGLTIWYAGEKI